MRISRLLALALGATTLVLPNDWTGVVQSQSPTEAPTGFDNLTNGFVTQSEFDVARADFDEREEIDEGRGLVSFSADAYLNEMGITSPYTWHPTGG